ncbi:MAG: hypothetical protein AUK02_01065 [Anaerolineae bacterium CG2_30_58_95]|nr:MAG: hypothetical protein AUK02_01065 [Anaerolineae bacterium CG2_30_58_95]
MFRPTVRLLLIFLALLAWSLRAEPALAQALSSQVSIRSPQAGEALQGQVTITGNSNVAGFVSAEVSFSYTNDPTGAWFLIAASDQPVAQGTLAVWDTTTITDGLYTLRLRVTLADGDFVDAIAPDLRVRNYTLVETSTPTAAPLQATPVPEATATATPYLTPTALPPNPAALSQSRIYASLGYGVVGALLFFLIFGVYAWARRHSKT